MDDIAVPRSRPPRFPIQAPIYFRNGCDKEWTESTTLNISRGGVLFQSSLDIEPKQVLQVRILFPSELTGGAPAKMLCKATVLRKEPKRSAVAASIAHCKFLRAE
jgi:hypothetical protein